MRQYKKRRNEKYCNDRFTGIFYIAYKYVSTQYVVQKYYGAFSGRRFLKHKKPYEAEELVRHKIEFGWNAASSAPPNGSERKNRTRREPKDSASVSFNENKKRRLVLVFYCRVRRPRGDNSTKHLEVNGV